MSLGYQKFDSQTHVATAFSSLTTLPAFGLVLPVALSNGQSGKLLDARAAFMALTLIQLVSSSIQDGAAHGMQLMGAIGSLQRVQSSLNENIWQDKRQHLGKEGSDTVPVVSSDSSSVGHAQEKVSSMKPDNREIAVAWNKITSKWSDETDVKASEISFEVPRNGLTVIWGPTGSGKSTLLGLIVGDSAPASGNVSTLDQQVGFCNQPPWIANLGIKDNIVGGLPVDETWYQTVIEICALDRDIKELADGDQHVCGLNGQSISGGQQARIVCNLYETDQAGDVCANPRAAGFGSNDILQSRIGRPRRLLRGTGWTQ